MRDLFKIFLDSLNETLAAAIVIFAASILLYNLTRNLRDRITRTSAIVLGCVTMAYGCDVLISLEPMPNTMIALTRIQWIGLAFIPVATYHLSDALLATTGLPSRGRRRRVIRILYLIATCFLVLAAFTDTLIKPDIYQNQVSVQAQFLFPLFTSYYIIANLVALLNVWRARRRCLTSSTQRRMTYLLFTVLIPSIGIFPYSALLKPGTEFSLNGLILVNIANILMILMLIFLSYPLSFFGSRIPDRVVKAELLRFILRGPMTGVLALIVIIFTEPTTQIIGVLGRQFMPFGVVAVILLWQWVIHIGLPALERRWIYHDEDDEQLNKLQTLSERLLTRSDLMQLLEAVLESACDYLRVEKAFVAALLENNPEFVRSVGQITLTEEALQHEITHLIQNLSNGDVQQWGNYWVKPLYSHRTINTPRLIGMLGVEATGDTFELNQDDSVILNRFADRAASVLDDILLQSEVYAALEGLLPQFTITRERAAEVEYLPGRNNTLASSHNLPERDQIIEQVRAALRHYWGGPGMTNSRLIELQVVQNALPENDFNAVKALRTVLTQAIENQRPEGERDYRSAEWLIYNILTLRFIDNKKVKDVARRLYISEANLYRKQNTAIEAVAETILSMEQQCLEAI
ncbi:MAG: hypothetical protein CUN56_05960 [Phototrophicales bacterium]|nr:MAG: hypothetical protein CUN56_05960 [Phototrophicales bacterium]RMG73416.1 MAG: hypothetical protein D6711_10915 [Chloroflexota bacterium]